jgi:hypothetical protein
MLPWQLMRFTKPESVIGIAERHYKFTMPEAVPMITGVLMMILLIAFVTGFKKKISYLLVLILHALGTLMTLPKLIIGLESFYILFAAAIPAVFAMLLLYILRDEDTMLSFDK